MKLPVSPPSLDELLGRLPAERLRVILREVRDPGPGDRWLHWNDLRGRRPPADLSPEEWWAGIRLLRGAMLRELPFRDPEGRPFLVAFPDSVLALLHEIDLLGRIELANLDVPPAARERYVRSSLEEEAIQTSLLEGAATTYGEAKDMLRTGRPPRNRGERMVLGSYRGLEMARESAREPLTPEFILALHETITRDTLDDPGAAGRLRTDADRVQLVDTRDGTILHVPPPAGRIPAYLETICDFANGKKGTRQGRFLHPIARAIVLHFVISWVHPFVDGNGRVARALCQWSMLRDGYWLAEFFSLSRIVRGQRGKYRRAFLETETDGNDVTYFLLWHLRALRRAIDELHRYLRKREERVREVEALLSRKGEFNYRQLALLSHVLRHPDATYTIEQHRRFHRVVYETARRDLLDLAERGWLVKRRRGKAFVFAGGDRLGALVGRRRPGR